MTETLLREHALGKDDVPDVLAVSLSTHDYVGHEYGPTSKEILEISLYEDKALARLFNLLDKHVPGGLSEVMIVLTSDHGIPPIPEEAKNVRMPAGRIDEKKFAISINAHLDELFGKASAGNFVLMVKEMNYYLNPAAIVEKKLTASAVEEAVRSFVEKNEPGILMTITKSDYLARRIPPGLLGKQFMNSYFPGRSGDLVSILKPYYIADDDNTGHMTGYSYDRTVPLLFAGRSIRPGIYAAGANIIDIAPTLSFLLGIVPPSMSEGRVLAEMLR